jgi:hypothetical protein
LNKVKVEYGDVLSEKDYTGMVTYDVCMSSVVSIVKVEPEVIVVWGGAAHVCRHLLLLYVLLII